MQKATRQHTKNHNSRLVLRTIYQQGNISRADIARTTGLSRPTVSRIVEGLMVAGFVMESGRGPSAGGKRPTLLNVAYDDHLLLALDLSDGNFRAALINLRGDIIHRLTVSANSRQGEEALLLVHELIEKMMAAASAPLLGIGIGAPGLINPQTGFVQKAVNLGWSNFPLGLLLAERYQTPTYLANDSNMAALGEFTFGRSSNASKNLVVIKVGQGVSAGIVLDGATYHGDGFGAGEIGHVIVEENGPRCRCGNYGCLEANASTRAILSRAEAVTAGRPDSVLAQNSQLSWDELLSALDAGDEVAQKIVADSGRLLGAAVANIVGTLNIHHILIAGRVTQFGQSYLSAIATEAGRRALPAIVAETEISFSTLGNDVVMLGCSATIMKYELGII